MQNASRTRSPRGKSPSGKCFDGHARTTSKELAPIHFVKSGTLQNACSTSQNGCRFGKSALKRIARLMNSLATRFFFLMVTKCSRYAENYTTICLEERERESKSKSKTRHDTLTLAIRDAVPSQHTQKQPLYNYTSHLSQPAHPVTAHPV